MPRARGSDEVEEEEKKEESSIVMRSSFKDLVLDWHGPDLVYETVEDWMCTFAGHCGKSTVGNFFQYCFPKTPRKILSSDSG